MGSLVTGIGYIGAQLAQLLLDSGEQVVGLDNLFSTNSSAIERLVLHPGFTLVEGDVRDETAVRRAFDSSVPIETVYHLAAQSSGNPSAAPARYTEETNLIGSRIVLEQACEAGSETFVFGSSLVVYGRGVEGTMDERHPYGPILDLSHLSKVHVEKLMEMYAINMGIRCVSARIGLVYGLGPVMKTSPRVMTAPNKFCLQAVNGEPIRVDATAYYRTGMIHVEDAARGMIALGTGRGRDRETGGYEAVNLIGEVASVAQVAEMVERLAAARGIDVQVERPALVPEAPTVRFGDTAERMGFQPRRSMEDGLAEVMDYFLSSRSSSTRRPSLFTDHSSEGQA